MNIELIGHDVRLVLPDHRAIVLSAIEILDLADWIRAHELDLQIKALEMERRVRQQREQESELSDE